MSKLRHLQGEIERTLKQVDEGMDLFLQFLKKFQSAPIGTQKDKFEREMSREVKKLQRHRDSIRVWVSSPDIKDKNMLLEYKRKIETQMEAFKACEKENKTKAYSREGLQAIEKLDQGEEEKMQIREWVQETQSQLMDHMNCLDAEIEALGTSRRSRDPDALAHLQSSLDQLRYHYDKLDQLLRKGENEGGLNMEKVQELQEVYETFIAADFNYDCEEAFQQVYGELDILKGSQLGSSGSVEEEPAHADTVKKPVAKKPAAPLEPAKRPIAPPPKVETKVDDRAVRETKSAVPSVWDFPSMARSTSVPAQEVVTAEIASKPVPLEEPLPAAPVEKPSLIVLLSKTQLEAETSLYDSMQDMELAQELIDTSFFYAIRPDDRARPSLIVLNTPFPCHPTFPKRPLFREAKRIEQVDLDTLFFIFYHQPGTYQQYLTAGHLQRQSWLYHRKEQTWFQREDNGRARTPGKGTYFYFDYTASWSQRLRQDFVFEPQHLETAISE